MRKSMFLQSTMPVVSDFEGVDGIQRREGLYFAQIRGLQAEVQRGHDRRYQQHVVLDCRGHLRRCFAGHGVSTLTALSHQLQHHHSPGVPHETATHQVRTLESQVVLSR